MNNAAISVFRKGYGAMKQNKQEQHKPDEKELEAMRLWTIRASHKLFTGEPVTRERIERERQLYKDSEK